MPQAEYIQVIVPVRLDQAFTYRVPEGLRGRVGVGARVKVRLGPRLTDAVVVATGVTPDLDPARIRDIAGLEEGLEPITPEEIRLWLFISDYYLCTQGEVFKCAYPSGKIRSEETAARARERAEASQQKLLSAARERVARLEAEMTAVRSRTDEALAGLTERAVKTRQKLLEARDARLGRLQEVLDAARATLAGAEGSRVEGEGRGLQAAGMNPVGEGGLQPPAFPLDKNETNAVSELTHALQSGKPILLQGGPAARHECYNALIAETLAQGQSALMLVPEVAMTEAFEAAAKGSFGAQTLLFHSRETTARRRKMADALRAGGPRLLIGTRSALFLPFRDLGLVIVDEEQDRSYKQDSPAPRYNARDCAIVLAGIHGAPIVLGSATPSLESLYNCSVGRYTPVRLEEAPLTPSDGRLRIIDTAAERRKRGMKGSFSIKLIDEIRHTLEQGGPVLLIRLWGDLGPTLEETRALFPDANVQPLTEEVPAAGIRIATLAQTKRLSFAEGSLVALLQADPIFGAQDFRADERAAQLLIRYREHCAAGTFVIQTSRAAHPVFQDLLAGRDPAPALLQERKDFGYPPFTRIIDLRLDDPNPKRLKLMGDLLTRRLQETLRPGVGLGSPVRLEGPFETAEGESTLRVILAKDRRFPERKRALKGAVDDFARERRYAGFIHLDVDPE